MANEFLDDLRAYDFSTQTRSQLGVDPSRPLPTLADLRSRGLFWIQPIFAASTAGLFLGVRLVPGAESLLDMPLVLVQGDRALTLASTLRSGLALTIIELALGPTAGQNWGILSARREDAEPELVGFEKLLGGNSIPRLFDVLEDDALRAGLQGEADARKEAVVTLYERLDPEQGAARRWIHGGAADGAPPHGAWQQVISTANFKRAYSGQEGFDRVRSAWDLFAGPVALDASTTGLVQQPESLRWRFRRWTGLHAARTLRDAGDGVPQEFLDDPLWPAVISLADQGQSCDGVPFVEAAAHLEESGQPERALAALAAASYLSSQALGQALSPIVEAAAFTAKRHGWALLESLFASSD